MDKPLKDIIKNVISSLEKREKEEIDLFKAWEKAAGKKASKHTKPAFIKSRRLVVNISDSSWLYKLTLEKRAILEALNKNFKGKKKIKELQFRIGEI
jgi:predicted nucleic acid-binding Zn ribbon protein